MVETFDNRYNEFFYSKESVKRQSDDTAGVTSPATLLAVGGAVFLANLLVSLSQPRKRFKLENDHFCGVTGGGKAECYFDCISVENKREPGLRLIKNLDCLDDCFDNAKAKECLKGLVEDVKKNGVCDFSITDDVGLNTGVYDSTITDCIQFSEKPLIPIVDNGTCSPETEKSLKNSTCQDFIRQLPPLLQNTATTLINSACSKNVSELYLEKEVEYNATTCGCTQAQFNKTVGNVNLPVTPTQVQLPPNPWGRRKKNRKKKNNKNKRKLKNDLRVINVQPRGTLPIKLKYKDGKDIKFSTKFDFKRTRNRYPWLCSLRSRDISAEHFCAVTLLSLPPKPTVVVGSAHCTYLCKNGDKRIPPCCCKTDTTDCRNDLNKCGSKPKVVEMEPTDAEIICGEWEIGSFSSSDLGVNDTVTINIKKIIRHPEWDPDPMKGPIKGDDIAVFRVEDEKLKNGGAHKYSLNTVCFNKKKQPIKRQTSEDEDEKPFGIQASWAEPPPLDFIMQYAPKYLPLYRDFFKQWHYRMEIVKCEDPQNSTFGALDCPSNTSYPHGVICARDSANTACFTAGESGSPLLTEDDKGRFYAEGILSFVKGRGCDIYSNNPSAYTNLTCYLPWIAEQYGMDYDGTEHLNSNCTIRNPGSKSTKKECLKEVRQSFGMEGGTIEKVEKCKNIPSSVQEQFAGERDCIFPFYYNGRVYNECILFSELDFVYPAFRCPIFNITKKKEYNGHMISDFGTEVNFTANGIPNRDCPGFACQMFQVNTYCAVNATDPDTELDPAKKGCDITERRAPFSVCKNNCPGVGALGIIAAGSLTFIAAATLGQGFLTPVMGLGAIGTVGGGVGLMMLTCSGVMCTASDTGQCCMIQQTVQGPVCPSRC